MRFLTYVLFLVVYALWLWGSYLLFEQLKRGRASLLITEGTILLTYGGFFAFIYLLAGLWSNLLVLVFVAASQLGVLLAYILNEAFGSRNEGSVSRIYSAGAEFGVTHPIFTRIVQVFCLLVVLGYPVAAGVVHFRYPWNSPILHVAAVKYTLIFLIFASYPMTLGGVVAMLLSENIDEGTRQEILMNQLGGMVPNMLFVALALWAFGAGVGDVPAWLPLVKQTFSPRIMILIVAFFLVFFILPYWIGTQRGSRRRRKLLEKQREFTAEVVKVLVSPTPAKYVPNLQAVRGRMGTEWQTVIDSSPILQLPSLVDSNPAEVDPQLQIVAAAVIKSKPLDPRFPYVDALVALDAQINDIMEFLGTRAPETIIQDAKDQGETLAKQRDAIDLLINPPHEAKPVMAVLVSTVVSTIVGAVASGIGQRAWAAISGGAVPK